MNFIHRVLFTRHRAAKLAYWLALAWLVGVWLLHAFSGQISDLELEPHLGSFGRNITDFASFLYQNDIGFFQQFRVGHWSVYLTVFLSSLGALGGLSALLTGLQRRKVESFSSERRSNILVLAGAVFFATTIGSLTVISGSRRKVRSPEIVRSRGASGAL